MPQQASALDEFIAVRGAGKSRGLQVANFDTVCTSAVDTNPSSNDCVQVADTDMLAIQYDAPSCIKLLIGSSSDGPSQEAVLRFQGILARSALPPVRAQSQ